MFNPIFTAAPPPIFPIEKSRRMPIGSSVSGTGSPAISCLVSAAGTSQSQQQLQQKRPNYAIVHLPEGTDVLGFYQLLLENGFAEVSFVNEVRENAFLPSGTMAGAGQGGQGQGQQRDEQQPQHQPQQQRPLTAPTPTNNDVMPAAPVFGGNPRGGQRLLLREDQMELVKKVLLHHRQQQQQQSSSSTSSYGPQQSLQQQPSSVSVSVRAKQLVQAAQQVILRAAPPVPPPQPPQPAGNSINANNNNNMVVTFSSSRASSSSSSTTNSPMIISQSQQQHQKQALLPEAKIGDNGGGGNGSAANSNNGNGNNTDEYSVCRLCNNRIMSSRLSNLTNHVRRHASMKQYGCCHCQYAHNEMAKVRLHMSHNHSDFDSQPVDQLTFEMQLQWGLLMEQCFPEHAKRFGPSAANSQYRCLDQLQKSGVDLERSFACIECGELVAGYRLVNHLDESHMAECTPFACADCGYESNSQWKVRLHISVKHAERAADVAVEQRPAGSNPMLFLHKFFADLNIAGLEEEEARLVAELQQKNNANATGRDESNQHPPDIEVLQVDDDDEEEENEVVEEVQQDNEEHDNNEDNNEEDNDDPQFLLSNQQLEQVIEDVVRQHRQQQQISPAENVVIGEQQQKEKEDDEQRQMVEETNKYVVEAIMARNQETHHQLLPIGDDGEESAAAVFVPEEVEVEQRQPVKVENLGGEDGEEAAINGDGEEQRGEGDGAESVVEKNSDHPTIAEGEVQNQEKKKEEAGKEGKRSDKNSIMEKEGGQNNEINESIVFGAVEELEVKKEPIEIEAETGGERASEKEKKLPTAVAPEQPQQPPKPRGVGRPPRKRENSHPIASSSSKKDGDEECPSPKKRQSHRLLLVQQRNKGGEKQQEKHQQQKPSADATSSSIAQRILRRK